MADPIYQDNTQFLSDLRSSEVNYRLSLSKLLGCCTPPESFQSQSCSTNEDFTKCVRKLIAYHTELTRIIEVSASNDVQSCVQGFERWCLMSVKVYHQYLKLFELRSQDLEMFRELKAEPLIRLEELYNVARQLQLDSALVRAFAKLHSLNERKLNDSLMRLDQGHFEFARVKDLYTLTPAFAYFNKDEIVKRDFFKMELLNHPDEQFGERIQSVELIKLKDGTVAVCGLLEIGRELLFPPLNLVDYETVQGQSQYITITHKEHDFDILFHAKAAKVLEWTPLFAVEEEKFKHSFYKLTGLNVSGEVGLGLGLGLNKLRKSADLLDLEAYDSSLIENYQEQSSEEEQEPEEEEEVKPVVMAATTKEQTPQLPTSKPATDLRIPQLTTTQVPAAPFTSLKHNNSSTDSLASSTKKQIKRRKSIFGLFKSKEPEFEIVHKDTFVPISQKQELSKKEEQVVTLFEKLNVTTNTSNGLSDFEHQLLSQCPVLTSEINDSVMLSTWQVNKWKQHSSQFQGTKIQFFTNDDSMDFDQEIRLMQISTPETVLLIRLNHHDTQFTKASALNLQIQYVVHQTKKVDLNLKCANSSVLNSIMSQYQAADSASKRNRSYAGSDTNSIFSDNLNHPSNSTSMSSVSILDQASGTTSSHGLKNRPSYLSLNTTHAAFSLPPKLNLSQISLHSNSSSLQTISPTSVASTVSEMSPIKTLNELLLKSNLTVKLHQQDHVEKEWIPLSMSRMNIFAVLSNEDFFRFDIKLSNPTTAQLKKIDTIVNKKGLNKVGKTGLQFEIVNDNGELKRYLIEFRNSMECQDIYTMLSC